MDERLRVEAAQKDPSQFAALYEANFARVYAFVSRRVRSRSEAQDITADVFHHALKNLGKYEWRGIPFAAWLYRIAANEIADHHQREARRVPNGEAPGDPPRDEVAAAERRAALFQSVDRLPPDQRRVIVARFAEEKSISDVARELGRSEGAVKQLQWRALQTLRAQMGMASHG